MNTKFNDYARTLLATTFPVRSFFGTLTAEHPLMDHTVWLKEGSPHMLVAAIGLPVKETNSFYVWFDNIAYGNYKCVVCRFDLDTFNPNTSVPTDGAIAPVGEATFLFDNANDPRPTHIVFPEYEDSRNDTRRVLWSKIQPADIMQLFPTKVD